LSLRQVKLEQLGELQNMIQQSLGQGIFVDGAKQSCEVKNSLTIFLKDALALNKRAMHEFTPILSCIHKHT